MEMVFGAGHEKCQGLMNCIESGKIYVGSVHNVERSNFDDDVVEDRHIVNVAGRNNHKGGNIPMQIQKGMKFDCALVLAKSCPWEKREAQIDDSRIENICGLVEFQSEGIVGIQLSSLPDEYMGEIGIYMPVAGFVGVGKCASGDGASYPGMIQFGVHGMKTSFDIAETFPIGELCECHAEELIETGECVNAEIALISMNAFVEFVKRKEIHELRENNPPSIHLPHLSNSKLKDYGKYAEPI